MPLIRTIRHLNCGAGRIVWQDIVRIDQTIKKNELLKQENIVKSFERAKNGNGRLHFLGLVCLDKVQTQRQESL